MRQDDAPSNGGVAVPSAEMLPPDGSDLENVLDISRKQVNSRNYL